MNQVAILTSPSEWGVIKEQATVLVESGFLPSAIKTPAQAIAIAMKGRELGIPMMQSFSHINIIQGKPTMSSELMLAQIRKLVHGAVIDFIERSDKRCIIEASRPGSKRTPFEFNLDNARDLGLLTKDNWKKQPKVMLQWRCVAEMARALFSDALMGVSYTPEELNPDVKLSEDGEVIDVTPAPKPPERVVLEVQKPSPAPTIEADFEGVEQALADHTPMHRPDVPRNADYKIPVGKFKGMALADVPIDELKKDLFWWEKNGKIPAAREYVLKAGEFLADLKPGDGSF